MRQLRHYLTAFLLLIVSTPAFSDSLSLTTYYPAPFGSYSLLRLVPTSDASMGACNASKVGQFYLSSDSDEVKICNGALWTSMGLWTHNAAQKYVYLNQSPTDTAYKLGIGMVNPQARLHVRGIDDSTNGQLRVESTGSSAQVSLLNSSGATSTGFGSIAMTNSAGAEGLSFKINNTERMIIDENGNMGIGISSPTTKLHISGADSSDGQLLLRSTGDNAQIHFEAGATSGNILLSEETGEEGLRFQTGTTDRMTIDENGNVGVGINAPAARLDVSRAATPSGNVSMAKFDNVYLIDQNEATYVSNALCSGTNCIATNNDFMGLRMLVNTAADSASIMLGVPVAGYTTSSLALNVGTVSALTATPTAVTTNSAVNVGIGIAAPVYKLHVNGPIGGALDRSSPAAVGELQVNCTTVPGKCYAVYAP